MQENIIISPRRGGVIVGTWNKKLSFIGLTLSGWAISDELYRGDNKILSGWQQNPVGVTQYWNSIGVCWAIGIQFGVVLEGFRGLNDFFIRLGVTTEFCRGDKNDPNVFGVHPGPSGCNPEQPRATPKHPDWASDEGCSKGQNLNAKRAISFLFYIFAAFSDLTRNYFYLKEFWKK